MKKVLLLLLILSLVSPLWALDVRSITTLQSDYTIFSEEIQSNSYVLEGTTAIKWTPEFTLLIKEYSKFFGGSEILGGGGGIVFPFGTGFYSEITAMALKGQNNTFETVLYADLNYERSSYYLLTSIRAEIGEFDKLFFSLGGRYYLLPPWHLWGRYTLVYNFQTGFNHSFWGQNEFYVNDSLFLILGGTFGEELFINGSPETYLQKSVLSGFSFSFVPEVTFKAILEYKWGGNRKIWSYTGVMDLLM